MTTILLDCDGVLADFVSPALEIVHRLGGPKLLHDQLDAYDIGSVLDSEEARDELWHTVSEPGFCASLKPYPGALPVVQELREIGTVVCVTSPMATSPTWAHERAEWLHDYFGFDRGQVISTSGKHYVAGDVFADDAAQHLARWRDRWSDRRALLVDRPWNRAERWSGQRVPTLAHVIEVARNPRGRVAAE